MQGRGGVGDGLCHRRFANNAAVKTWEEWEVPGWTILRPPRGELHAKVGKVIPHHMDGAPCSTEFRAIASQSAGHAEGLGIRLARWQVPCGQRWRRLALTLNKSGPGRGQLNFAAQPPAANDYGSLRVDKPVASPRLT